MKTIYVDKIKSLDKPTVVCLGFFDGVHIGHASLIARAKAISARTDAGVCVHTFDQMPARALNPGADILELTPLAEKAALLEMLGVDVLAVSRFADTVHMRAADFFRSILLDKLLATHIVAGFHHHFGYRGEADVKWLKSFCAQAGVGLDIIEPITLAGGELVSSTAIRQAVQSGDYAKASLMLGRPYTPGEPGLRIRRNRS